MSSSLRFLALILFVLLCVPVCVHAQTPPKPTAKTPRGTISGRVTIKDKPAAGVTVGLRQIGGMSPLEKPYKAVTDQEGVYRITNVAPGNYEIAPSTLAYVVAETNMSRGKSVVVGEDENVEDINFSLIRGGVITGKLTDAQGRVVIEQTVNLYRAGDFMQQPLRQVFTANSVQTDDRGIYRFFGLAPGRYKVASGRGDALYAGTFVPTRTIYRQVFHPDATDQTKATIIEVREGSEATNVDITLGSPAQTFTVTGRVVDAEKGLPVPNIRFAFQRNEGERFEMAGHMTISNSLGDFVAEGFAPGKYAVLLFGNQGTDLRAEATWFEVFDQDVSGVTVKLSKGSTVSGVVVLEHDDKLALRKLLEMQLYGYVTAPQGAPMSANTGSSAISPDGTFRLTGLSPGHVNLWLGKPMSPTVKGFAISRVEHNGVVLPGGIETREGEQLEGVKVFVSYGTATVRGMVSVENGTLPDGARMFVRLSKPGTPPTIVANAMADARGHFLLDGVPAGLYELSVEGASPSGRIPATSKQQINVQDGAVTEVSLKLDLTPPAKP